MNKTQLIEEFLGKPGTMIAASKGRYRFDNPKNLVFFNANVVTKEDGKLWFGDLDITKQSEDLKQLAKALGTTLYVLQEMDARFENENSPKIEKAVFQTNGAFMAIAESLTDHVEIRNKKFYIKPIDEAEIKVDTRKVHYNKDEYPTEIQLPPLTSFRSNKSGESPIYKFHMWVADQFGGVPKGHVVDVGASCLRHEDYETLEKITETWIAKYHTKGDAYSTQKELGWHMLDIGPSNFLKGSDPEWSKPGHVYIKKAVFRKV